MNVILGSFLSILILFLAISYPYLSKFVVNTGMLKDLGLGFGSTILLSQDACKLVFNEKNELYGCEDAALINNGHQALLACVRNPQTHLSWFPPLKMYNQSGPVDSGMSLYDFKSGSIIPLQFKGFSSLDYTAHGIGVLTDPQDDQLVHVAALNHRKTGSVIELFTYKIGSTEMVHRKTIKNSKLLNNPNDVVLVDKDSFYATNDFASLGLKREIATFYTFGDGHVVFYDGESEKMRIVARDIAYANGIASNPALDEIYVVSALKAELKMFNRKEGNGLRLMDSVALGFLGDNVFVEPTTGAIYVTGHQNGAKFALATQFPGTKTPSLVVKIENNTAQNIYYGKKYQVTPVWGDDGTLLSSSTITLVSQAAKKSLIGGIFTKGVLICDLL